MYYKEGKKYIQNRRKKEVPNAEAPLKGIKIHHSDMPEYTPVE